MMKKGHSSYNSPQPSHTIHLKVNVIPGYKDCKSVLVFTYSCCLGMTIQPPMHVLGDV